MNQNVAAYLPGLAHPTPSEKTENYTVTSGQGGHWNHHLELPFEEVFGMVLLGPVCSTCQMAGALGAQGV